MLSEMALDLNVRFFIVSLSSTSLIHSSICPWQILLRAKYINVCNFVNHAPVLHKFINCPEMWKLMSLRKYRIYAVEKSVESIQAPLP